jgi:hypothetical protein
MKCEKCDIDHDGKFGSGRFCSRKCANSRSLTSHVRAKISQSLKGRKTIPWNKGLSKREVIMCQICSKEIEVLPSRKPKTCGSKECISKYQSTHTGGYRIGSGRCKGEWYESHIAGRVYLHSSYEVVYAKWLDKNEIQWKRNTDKFNYFFEGKEHFFIPDFYLITDDCYIELKGFKTIKDESKWRAFPHKLKILNDFDLYNMGLIPNKKRNFSYILAEPSA